MKKTILFNVILVFLVVAIVEAGARTLYFVTRGRFSHLLSSEEITGIRKHLPYKRNWNEAFIEEKGGALIKNGYYVYNPKRNINREGTTDEANVFVEINSLGFRGKEIESKNDKVRIICLGGSSTFGYMVKTPYPKMLEQILNKERNMYDVVNCGVVGYNLQHIYNLLRDEKLIKKINPNIVLLNNYWNSIEQCDNSVLIDAIENKPIRGVLRKSIVAFFIYKTVLYIKYKESIGPFQFLSLYLDKICSWAEERGIKVVLVKEPMILDKNAWRAAPQHPNTNEHAGLIFRRFEKKYSRNVFYISIDFFEDVDFKKKYDIDEYAMDRGHLTEKGYRIEAEDISNAILTRLDFSK